MLIRTTKCTLYWRERLNKLLKQDPAESLREFWSYCDCKCCVDIYIQMSFSCTTSLPAELQQRVQYYFEERECETHVYAHMSMYVFVCLWIVGYKGGRYSLLSPLLILTKSRELNPALYFSTLVWLCCAVLCNWESHRLLTSIDYILSRTGMLLFSV